MNIVVCIKQVPDTTEIKIDPVKNTLIRTGVPSIMNPFDKNALETGLQLKDRYGGKVTVISMGPPQAKAVLREALAMGADEAYLVTDRAFGGSDTYATSYILSQAIQMLGGFDVILGGKQAIEVIEASLPVLCTATKESNKPRYATIKGVLTSLRAEIGEITLASLPGSDTTKMGLKGSPTKVKATFTPKRNANCMNIEGSSPAETAGTLIDRLTEAKVL